MDSGTLTSEKLVQLYLARIEAYDKQGPKLNTVITLNKNALAEARALDAGAQGRRARARRCTASSFCAKDVFDTYDMPTTGGFKPMATSQPTRDAFVIDRLRKSGAIVLAKLNQSDWYGVAPSGGSTLAGQPISPYNAEEDDRRLELGHRRRDGSLVRHRRTRQRHERLDRHSEHAEQSRRLLHDAWTREPHRHDVELAAPGKRRTDVPQRVRLRRGARRRSPATIPPISRPKRDSARFPSSRTQLSSIGWA